MCLCHVLGQEKLEMGNQTMISVCTPVKNQIFYEDYNYPQN